MKRLLFSLLLLWPSFAFAQTSIQWGANRGVSPWQVGVYDNAHVFRPLFTQPATGGGQLLLPAAVPPPTASTLGGVESIVQTTHNFVQYIDTFGVPHLAQPAFTDLSGAIACSQLPTFTGDVTNVNCAMTIAAGAVTSAKIASGAAATNVGTLSGDLAGSTLPSPVIAAGVVDQTKLGVGAAAANIGTLGGGDLAGTLPSATVARVTGITDGTTAAPGFVGQVISSSIASGSAVALTTNTNTNVTSISLTAGDWDCWANLDTYPAGSTVESFLTGAISQTSATFPANPNGGAIISHPASSLAGVGYSGPIGTSVENVSTTATIYLVIASQFITSTNAAGGFLGCRRRR